MKYGNKIRRTPIVTLIITILALPVFVLSISTATQAQNITDNLLSYYSFDSDWSDDYGTNDFTKHEDVQHIESGKLDGCVQFTAGHLEDTDFDFPNNNMEFTLSFWMWVDTGLEQNNEGEGDESGYAYLVLFENGVGNYNRPVINVKSSGIHDRAYLICPTDNLITPNNLWDYSRWHHVVYTYGNSLQTIYVDNEVAFAATNTDPVDPVSHLLIGDHWSNRRRNYVGLLDELGIWNRVLSETEVSLLYGNGSGFNPVAVTDPQQVALDIKPGSCPNPLNVKHGRMDGGGRDGGGGMAAGGGGGANPANSEGVRGKQAVVPVAILGTAEVDVTQIDATTVVLAGVPAIRSGYEDVSAPVGDDADECACNNDGSDGFVDMTFKFDKAAIIAALGDVSVGDVVTFTISGQLIDGTPFEGEDCVVIVGGGSSPIADDSQGDDDAALSGVTNFPNPFNPVTTISFNLPTASSVTLSVYNTLGQKVATVADGFFDAGSHAVEWDGSSAASGVYFYRIETDGFVETKKMVLMK